MFFLSMRAMTPSRCEQCARSQLQLCAGEEPFEGRSCALRLNSFPRNVAEATTMSQRCARRVIWLMSSASASRP